MNGNSSNYSNLCLRKQNFKRNMQMIELKECSLLAIINQQNKNIEFELPFAFC